MVDVARSISVRIKHHKVGPNPDPGSNRDPELNNDDARESPLANRILQREYMSSRQ